MKNPEGAGGGHIVRQFMIRTPLEASASSAERRDGELTRGRATAISIAPGCCAAAYSCAPSAALYPAGGQV